MWSNELTVARLVYKTRFVKYVLITGEREVGDVVHTHVDAVNQEFPFKT
jgi:predicted RNA-binding protein with TRAM domain